LIKERRDLELQLRDLDDFHETENEPIRN